MSDLQVRRLSAALDVIERHSIGRVCVMSKLTPWCSKMHAHLNRINIKYSLADEDLEELKHEVRSLVLMFETLFDDVRTRA